MTLRGDLHGALLMLAAALLACGIEPAEPSQVAERYFVYLRADPLRLLLLLTPELHRRHGMTLDAYLRTPPGAALLASRARTAPDPAPWTLSRAQAAWLDAQGDLALEEAAAHLSATIEAVETNADRARVRTRVAGPAGSSFAQDFLLVRDPGDGAWRIEDIEQRELDASNLYFAFAAFPCQETLDRLYAEGLLR